MRDEAQMRALHRRFGNDSGFQLSVVGAHIRVCVPGLKLVGGKIKTKGTLTVKWASMGENRSLNGDSKTFELPLENDGVDPRKTPKALIDALTGSISLVVARPEP